GLSGTPALSRVEPQLGSTDPLAFLSHPLPDGLQGSNFSARWTGTVTPPETGKYVLAVAGPGGARVWLDGEQIVDDWTQHSANGRINAPPDFAESTSRNVDVTLERGRSYSLKVEFFHSAASAGQVTSPMAGGSQMGYVGPTLAWVASVSDANDAVAA